MTNETEATSAINDGGGAGEPSAAADAEPSSMAPNPPPPPPAEVPAATAGVIVWTPLKVVWTLGVFLLAGLAGKQEHLLLQHCMLEPAAGRGADQACLRAAPRRRSDQPADHWRRRRRSPCPAPAEIGGGWLVWQFVRSGKPWWYLLCGCLVLCAYGFIPTLQPPEASFSRVYVVYGGVFILLSYLWGWLVDGDRPDVGDWVGAGIAIAGVLVAWFWPRT
jgi:drug/metabolite transporter superfamily protein YnfA